MTRRKTPSAGAVGEVLLDVAFAVAQAKQVTKNAIILTNLKGMWIMVYRWGLEMRIQRIVFEAALRAQESPDGSW
ncbi:MAG: hypothetical protein V4555_14560 [Acidobacteriota bacterium]